jgi:hypothetical protein
MKFALLLVAVVASGGCADNDLSLSIVQMEALAAPMCVATATVGVGHDRGVLDVSLVTLQGYIAVPLVRNNLVSRIPAAGGVEYNAIQLTGANVKLDLPTAMASSLLTAAEKSFHWAAAPGRLDPGGLAPMFVEAVPAPIAKKLAAAIPTNGLLTLTAEVRPTGKQGNSDVTGGPDFFPVDLCSGCLAPGSASACPLPKGTTVQSCFPWQDQPTPCCRDTAGNLLCGAQAPVSTM